MKLRSNTTRWRSQMTRFKVASAAALVSMMIATPAFAQAAIQEPGAFAFYHPNRDVLNGGAPLWSGTTGSMASVPFSDSNDYYRDEVRAPRHSRAASRHIMMRHSRDY